MFMEKNMSISLKIIDSIKSIEKNINSAIAIEINNILSSKQNYLLSEVKKRIPLWIESQPEIISLKSNDIFSLAGQLGIPGDVTYVVNAITNAVKESTSIKFIKYTPNLKGVGLELHFQPSDFKNLLSLNEGHVNYNNGDLHWLDWLLIKGNAVIITNYQYNPSTGLGRSGLGNMIPGNFFRIPPQFAGTIQDNFVTRAFLNQNVENEILNLFKSVLS